MKSPSFTDAATDKVKVLPELIVDISMMSSFIV